MRTASDPSLAAAGVRPTIALAPNHGYMGQQVTATGEGAAPYPGVRVVWLTGGATRTAAVVAVGTSKHYSALLTVPEDAEPGPAQICATVTGTAEFVWFRLLTPLTSALDIVSEPRACYPSIRSFCR